MMAFELHQSKRKWRYENILATGDFNISIDNSHLEAFMQAYDFSSLIKKPACYQSNTPSCTDLILTNRKRLVKLSNTFETGLSDHHQLVCTTLKSEGFKGTPLRKYINPTKHLTLVTSKAP